MIKSWDEDAWEDYLYWQENDRKTLRRINAVIRDIERGGYSGIGKPEPLTGNLSGYWSRRIDACNRIVYRITGDSIEIIQCGSHYRDK
ncbi:Txe/YoeB family addiction module toxin [Synergistes jonesii]|uniref:Txe/YoeB family addiction module toxin n=1 Tax=Synergistes jonesii TaxID=2754 RepID=UPI00248E9C34|nr:Txe/YoeB family addiction module toxin [Synergistes jonesii]